MNQENEFFKEDFTFIKGSGLRPKYINYTDVLADFYNHFLSGNSLNQYIDRLEVEQFLQNLFRDISFRTEER